VARCALSSISALALHFALQSQDGKGDRVAAFSTALDEFLRAILQALVFTDMDNSLVKSASEALYPLISTRRVSTDMMSHINLITYRFR
jgi:hypothetical protein